MMDPRIEKRLAPREHVVRVRTPHSHANQDLSQERLAEIVQMNDDLVAGQLDTMYAEQDARERESDAANQIMWERHEEKRYQEWQRRQQ